MNAKTTLSFYPPSRCQSLKGVRQLLSPPSSLPLPCLSTMSSTTSPTLQPAAQPVHTQTQTRTQAQTQTETQRPPTRQRPTLGTPPTWDNLPVFNILLLGPTQSGKSTFIETVKQYADPSYSPNNARIGTGNESHTQEVHVEIITTNLPAYRLYDLEDNLEINITRSLSGMSDRAYKKLLARDDDLTLLPEEVPGSSFVQFRLFDTPGLDDTNGNDIQNIARTFTGLSGVNEFHMVLLIDSHEVPLTISQKAAFQTYFGLFEELKSLITVVHTKFDNFHRHPSSTKLRTKLQGRSQFFNDITGRNLPTKVIDCDLDETGPAHICLTRNTIREILEIATIKTPVTRNRAYVHKALVMGNVDKIVHTKYKAKLDSVNKSCDALGKADKLAIKIAGIEKDIKAIESTVHEYDSDDLFTLYENRFDEEWTFFGWVKDQTMSFPNQQYTIDKMRVARQCMDLLHEAGGEGHKFWDVRFKRESFHSGYFHVVISATLRTKHRKEIEGLRSELDRLRRDLENETREHQKLCAIVQQNTNDSSATLEQLKSKIDKYGKVLDHTSAMRLGLDEFLELANAGIYRGSDVLRSADALENQLAKRFAIDWSWR
ncbi:hypothetical protein B0O80DRAFT_459359 [Mortierella sp. GBAus27b]|nr:hypothetical protein B0O80DRAFT_459359 [Mortierella sp. GBAus27b]